MPSIQSTLFYAAAAINILIIPKHVKVSATNMSDAIKTIPEHSPAIKRGKEVVGTTWDLSNGSLIILALLNYRWAKTQGPSNVEEKLMAVVSVLSGWYVGLQYFKIGIAAVNPYYITTPYDAIAAQLREQNQSFCISFEQGMPVSRTPPTLGNQIVKLDSACDGLRMDFYAGNSFEGDIVATSFWKDSHIYLMSVIKPSVSGPHIWGLTNTGKAKLYIDDQLIIDNTDGSETSGSFMGCVSREAQVNMSLVKGQSYHVRVGNIVVTPSIKAYDNTLFDKASGIRIGLLPIHDEKAMLQNAIQVAKKADLVLIVVGLNADEEKEGGDRSSISLPLGADQMIQAITSEPSNVAIIV
ncbi:putative beta-glucosidase K [Colletotrichum gloeosporioides]|uniref:Probable beta-glucosidase I n=1 Tax=Colletotrichum gloeosporioides TaxID=474922 RepID=A0A8H4CQE4_COLGL|nr:putative beta-glucosidase K [Colletotrichum gloeosporioides]KAF3807976.1 putative beta-glucosidase K [Colletotrichum gloeosporioides]